MVPKFSFDKRRIKFLLLEGIHANATESLAANGYANVKTLPKSLTGEALKTASEGHPFPRASGPGRN